MQITLTYDQGFDALMERLRTNYPAEAFDIDGIGEKHLDIHAMSKGFFGKDDSTTADHSADPNANVAGRDVITYAYEVPKPLMKLNSYYNLWKTLSDLYNQEVADCLITMQVTGDIYINDVWDIGRPYCFNFSTLDIAREGLKMGGRLTVAPPKGLASFLRQVEQFTVYAANSTLGATGMADLLIVAARYVEDILKTGFDNHVRVADVGEYSGNVNVADVHTYVRESLTSLIYTLNWEFRGNQSPFTNVSIYDNYFLKELLPSYSINGKVPNPWVVSKVQSIFLEAYNDVLARTPATFPVITACFSTEEKDGHPSIRDERFLKDIAYHNLPYGIINMYCGESSTLSSCCRLRSKLADIGYANTFGAGGTKIGSLGVVTLNLPRLAAEAEDIHEFLEELRFLTCTAGMVNHAKRVFIKERIERGSLPLYTLGYMDLKNQYSTVGFTGLYEALQLLGYDMKNAEGLQAAEDTLTVINEMNDRLATVLDAPHNMEQVPAETSAIKLAMKNKLFGYDTGGVAFYSNQFIPLWENVDILDRIKAQGHLDRHCTGGAICHLNIGNKITNPDVMEALIRHAAEAGVIYFAVNYQINKCEQGHMSVGRDETCSICEALITDTYTRVVGFLTNTKHWHKTRREHDWPERNFQ